MHRRDLLHLCAAPAIAAVAPMLNFGRCRLQASDRQTYSVRAVDIVESTVVVDMLGLLTLDWPQLQRWHTDPDSFSGKDFDFLRASGVSIFHPAVDLRGEAPDRETREWLSKWNRFIDMHSTRLTRIDTCRDLAQARTSGRIGILLGMQNSEHFQSPADVHEFWALGQRLSQLTYNGINRIGTGCVERYDHGLTPFGATIIDAMNETGMMIDVSHAGELTTLNSFEASRKPVLITHSNCKALVPHPRCKSDAVIQAMARKGGVMGITYIQGFLRRSREATLEDALDHFDHLTRVAGPEHAGLGSDTDLEGREGFGRQPNQLTRGLNHPRRLYDLTEGLLRRRYKISDIQLILGGNFARVMSDISYSKSAT